MGPGPIYFQSVRETFSNEKVSLVFMENKVACNDFGARSCCSPEGNLMVRSKKQCKEGHENTANYITYNAEILFQGFLESINGYNASIFKGGAWCLQLTDRSRGYR